MRRPRNVRVSNNRACELIRAPVVTEKSTLGNEHNQVTFRVPVDATKLVPLTFVVVIALVVMGGILIIADLVNPISLFG